MIFTFQQSLIWDARKEVDQNQPLHPIKARSEQKARRKLPEPELGRVWILVEESE